MVNEQRRSNIELLRLVLMFFILMHHYLLKGYGLNAGFYNDVDLDLSAAFLDPFFFVGVNCFVLISGYFGIKFKFKGLYRLFIQCAFYGLLFYLLHLIIDHAKLGRSIIDNVLFVFSTPPGWWFIRVYIYLFLLSPILNKVINDLNQSQFKIVLLLLAVLNLYFGYLRQTPFNPDGYNIANFIFLYFIGRYLKLYWCEKSVRTRIYLLGYLTCSAIMGVMVLLKHKFNIQTVLFNVHIYNNPLLILASTFLLLTFASMRISFSKAINWLSFSALSIYLITENCYFEQRYYSYVGSLIKDMPILLSWLSLFAVALFTMTCCILIDKLRLVVAIPIDKLFYGVMDKLDAKFLGLWKDK